MRFLFVEVNIVIDSAQVMYIPHQVRKSLDPMRIRPLFGPPCPTKLSPFDNLKPRNFPYQISVYVVGSERNRQTASSHIAPLLLSLAQVLIPLVQTIAGTSSYSPSP